MEMPEGSLVFSLRIVPLGALLDVPSADLYGYPCSAALLAGDSIRLSFSFGGGELDISAVLSDEGANGTFRQDNTGMVSSGAITLARSSMEEEGFELSLKGKDGAVLPGILLLPAGISRVPLVILHAGLGASDRDGNNYNVPGRNDALKQLAQALAAQGIASYRYDKRGSGASTWLVQGEQELSFEAWIDDCESIVASFKQSDLYSGVWLLGLNDGAIVAAAAANASAGRGHPIDGLIVACASADGTLDAFKKAIDRAPKEKQAEGEAILESLLAGRRVESLSEFYAASFRPSFQPYLMEAFSRDIETELEAYAGPCLIAQGNMDMQATLADMQAMLRAKPDAKTVIPLRMNHVLKDVSNDVEDNYAAFSNPSYPVSVEFVDTLLMFIEGML